jgi:hypothetical protein
VNAFWRLVDPIGLILTRFSTPAPDSATPTCSEKSFFRAENRPKIDPNVLKMDFKTHRKFTFGLSVVVMAYSFDAFCWLKQQHQQKIKGTLRI